MLQVLDDVWTLDVGGWLGRMISGQSGSRRTGIIWIVVRGSDGHECSGFMTNGVSSSVRAIACPDTHFVLTLILS